MKIILKALSVIAAVLIMFGGIKIWNKYFYVDPCPYHYGMLCSTYCMGGDR